MLLVLLVALLASPGAAAGGVQTCIGRCAVDCDDGGSVTIDELLRGVGIFLGRTPIDACPQVDADFDGATSVSDLLNGVIAAQRGCAVALAPPPTAGTLPDDLTQRPLPEWYADAKLGIMIHWGPFAVPAWAERTVDPERMFTDPSYEYYFFSALGVEAFLQHNPYSEWYRNSFAIEGSGTWQHHRDTWGADFAYEDFAPMFEAQLAQWRPNTWARIFRDAGARYVVLVTKHHDGYTLWPSDLPNPELGNTWQPGRDVVGELTDAVRNRCMRMGLYYSGGIDWTWEAPPFATIVDALRLTPAQPAYADYVDAHWRELIDRYEPSVLWNDIAAPPDQDSEQLFRDYYAAVPDGVVNDRWNSGPVMPHRDFRTAEFAVDEEIAADKWEAVRGMSRGFGYNINETEADYGPPEKFVHMLIDVVAKNGNLLLNVGPRADGSIPEPQLQILARLGRWLSINGEAIYDTRPWLRHAATTDRGVAVRFTASRSGKVVYAILLGTPPAGDLIIEGFDVTPAAVRLPAQLSALAYAQTDAGLRVTLPELPADGLAHVIAIDLP